MSGPCLSVGRSQCEISLTCTLSIQRSLDIMDPSIPDAVCLKRILAGLLGFHNYSLHHWLTHLHLYEECSTQTAEAEGSQVALAHALHETAHWHNILLSLLGKQMLDPLPEQRQAHRLERLCSSPEFALLLQALPQETKLTTSTLPQDDGHATSVSHELHTKTLFNDLRRRYETFLITLTGSNSQNGHNLNEALIAQFQNTFGRTAFHCSFPGCARESVGFPTIDSRDKHELQHLPRLLCTEKSCLYASAIGFHSAKDLKTHTEKHHSRNPIGLPKFRLTSALGSPRKGTMSSKGDKQAQIEERVTDGSERKVTFSGSGPGKTAPKLHLDFLAFDPQRVDPNFNHLARHPLPAGEWGATGPIIDGCRHEYSTKPVQSSMPPVDLGSDTRSELKVAVICKKCRIHADIKIDFTYAQHPCPNSAYPLHHFQRALSRDQDETVLNAWQCSAPQCRAFLTIIYRLPRLESVDILTNTDKLKRRYEDVVSDDPSRDGFRLATPMDALRILRTYVKDSLDLAHKKRAIPINNKRFMEIFGLYGRDCVAELESLGFENGVGLYTAVNGLDTC